MNKGTLAIVVALVLVSGCSRPHTAPAEAVSPSIAPSGTAGAATAQSGAMPAQASSVPPGSSPGAADSIADDPAHVDQAIDRVLGDHAAYRRVMAEFQRAVAAHDAAGVAALVAYPIGVDIHGRNTVIRNRQQFIHEYDNFMTPAIAKAIVDSRYGTVMVNDQGVMLGRGEAWINGVCKDSGCKHVDVRVVTIQGGPAG